MRQSNRFGGPHTQEDGVSSTTIREISILKALRHDHVVRCGSLLVLRGIFGATGLCRLRLLLGAMPVVG